jgi:hypothetical protein
MGRSRTYPLAAVARSRQIERDAAARRVAALERDVDECSARLERARRHAGELLARRASIEDGRRRSVLSGVRSHELAADLQREDRLRREHERALELCERARAGLTRAEERLRDGRLELAAALAELRAVERHERDWERRRSRVAEFAAEEDP